MEKIWWVSLFIVSLLLLNQQSCEGRKLHDDDADHASASATYLTHLQLRNTKMVKTPVDPLLQRLYELLGEEISKHSKIESTLSKFKRMKEEDLMDNSYQLFDDGKQLADYVKDITYEEAMEVFKQQNHFENYKEYLNTYETSCKMVRERIIREIKEAFANFWPEEAMERVTKKIEADVSSINQRIKEIEDTWFPTLVPSDPEAVKNGEASTDRCFRELAGVGIIIDRMEKIVLQIIHEREKPSEKSDSVFKLFLKTAPEYMKQLSKNTKYRNWKKVQKLGKD